MSGFFGEGVEAFGVVPEEETDLGLGRQEDEADDEAGLLLGLVVVDLVSRDTSDLRSQ